MFTQQPKKLLIMNILDILRRYTDENHRLSQRDIMELLKSEYNMTVDRKAIKRNLMNLIDCGYPLEFSERTRKNRHGEDEVIYTDWYLEHEFTDAELRLLIDSLLFSKHIPYIQCKALISKIESLSNRYFHTKVRHVCNLAEEQPENRELFLTIETLDEAIEQQRQVEFFYADYGPDFLLHPRLDETGAPRRYLVNPYQMAATNGRYYLIGNYDKYDNISHYRIDRIREVHICDTPAKPQSKVEGLEYGLNLPKHMAEHIYMFSGDSAPVEIHTTRDMVGELIDWFGNGVRFSGGPDNMVTAHVTANLTAMRYWALQYAPYVTVVAPEKLVSAIRQDLQKSINQYTG